MSSLWHAPQSYYDILVAVMNILAEEDYAKSRRTIAVISRTCRCLRVEGVRRLLSCPVRVNVLSQTRRVAPFCRLILGDPIVRIPLLRRLSVDVRHLEEDAAQLLADVLAKSSYLEHLEINSLLEVTKPVLHTLCSALVSITSLTHLAVGFCEGDDPSYYQIFYHAFQTLQSQLTSIQVVIPSIDMPSERILYMRLRDPIALLSKLGGSVRTLKFDGLTRVGGGIRVYPLVEELQTSNYILGMPDLQTFILCFPNLRHLRCGSPRCVWIRYWHDLNILQEKCCLTTIQQWHDFNKRSVTGNTQTWMLLQSFRGSIADAYVLALPCRVAHLHLLSTGGKRSAEHTMLSTILSDTLPSTLRLSLKIHAGRNYWPLLPWPQQSSTWVQGLTTLEVCINIVKQGFDLETCVVSSVRLLGKFQQYSPAYPQGSSCGDAPRHGCDLFPTRATVCEHVHAMQRTAGRPVANR